MNVSFNNCTQRKCVNLRNGRLYHCPTCIYVGFYNKYFGKNIPVSGGIDIYSNSGKQIIDLLNKPIETCKFCFDQQNQPWHRKPWKRTEIDVNEWNY